MKNAQLLSLAAILLALLPAAARAQSANNINPALLYYQAFEVAPKLTPADDEYFTNTWQLQRLPEQFADLVARHNNEFSLLRKAAQSTAPCEWGIDLSEGADTLLPHLARCKAAAIATRLRVEWETQHGRPDDAVEDFLAAFVLARSVAQDGTLISTLVELASESIHYSTLAENFGHFSAENLQRLADGFAAAPQHRVSQCVQAELALSRTWGQHYLEVFQRTNGGDNARTMAALRALLAQAYEKNESSQNTSPGADWWAELSQAGGGTAEGVMRVITQTGEALAPRLSAVLDLPYSQFDAAMKQFRAEIHQPAAEFVSRNLQNWERAKRREFRVQVWRAMARAAIEYKLHGEAGLASVQDPAGEGPFAFRRFVFGGVDRGFELKSAIDTGNGWPEALIFVEKEGPPFRVVGRNEGEAIQPLHR